MRGMANELGLTGWRRVVYWLASSPIGIALWGFPLLGLILLPTRWWGLGSMVAVLAVCLAFVAGWAAARRHWRKNGFVPKL
jgi:hypothetical protein